VREIPRAVAVWHSPGPQKLTPLRPVAGLWFWGLGMSLFDGISGAFLLAIAAVRARHLMPPEPRARKTVIICRQPAVSSNGALDLNAVYPVTFRAVAARMDISGQASLKRIFDIVLSLTTLILLSPVMLVAAAAITLETPGPIIYRQQRVGRGGKLFNVLKFRSMTADAEKDGPRYADVNDARITKTGRILRKFRLDEIPQAFNVLKGEMSFVGPRPERPEFVRELEQEIPNYHCRHVIKPGITGWAQVKYEYAASVEGARRKLRYDLYYIRNFSFFLDLLILVMTVRVALFGLGSR
jgi:exopolysaccharide biosynthesis polyprenyl glycosylphosphotransferase